MYEALVRLAQTFVMKVPLIDGHGKFSPAAAMRHTECRLSKIASETLLDEFNLDTSDVIIKVVTHRCHHTRRRGTAHSISIYGRTKLWGIIGLYKGMELI